MQCIISLCLPLVHKFMLFGVNGGEMSKSYCKRHLVFSSKLSRNVFFIWSKEFFFFFLIELYMATRSIHQGMCTHVAAFLFKNQFPSLHGFYSKTFMYVGLDLK